MFDLEKALASWRRTLVYNRAFLYEDLDELEKYVSKLATGEWIGCFSHDIQDWFTLVLSPPIYGIKFNYRLFSNILLFINFGCFLSIGSFSHWKILISD